MRVWGWPGVHVSTLPRPGGPGHLLGLGLLVVLLAAGVGLAMLSGRQKKPPTD